MKKVRAKKHLGQHFLKDPKIAQLTADAFGQDGTFRYCLEIGPGMGILTEALAQRTDLETHAIDIDTESIDYLKEKGILPSSQIIEGDFLQMNLHELTHEKSMGIIGNFPYNISTQILFKVYESKELVREVVGMFQKEVAERVVSPPGSKVYGITSVLLQAFYTVEYLFTINEEEFDPPPRVKSAIIRLKRNEVKELACDQKLFKQVVKAAFNQRRKTLRNALKSYLNQCPNFQREDLLGQRAEQLSVDDFVSICQSLQTSKA